MVKSLFLSFTLAVIAVTFHNVAGQTNSGATWRVQKYDLAVTLPQNAERSISVHAVLTVKNITGAPVSSLTLRIAPTAEVSTVQINSATVDFAKSEEKLGSSTLQRLGTRFAAVAPGNTVTATVDYRFTVKENGGVASISPVGGQVLPLAYWYPTPNSWFFTKGADAAPVTMKVNATGLMVASSGTEAGGQFDQKLNTQPFFAVGSWDTVTASGVTVNMPKGTMGEAPKRAADLAALFAEARTFMSGVFGGTPDTPLRIVSSRRGAGFSTAGTLVVDEAVFRRPKVDSLTAMNIAEAAAKLWLGGSVGLSGEGNGTIGEGLSRYLATQFLESKFGKDVADIERLRQRNAYAAVARRDSPMATVSPLDDFYYPVVANKGAMVWRILAKRVGSGEFAAVIKSAAADGNMSLSELRDGFGAQKPLVDYFFDQITDMNLLAGIPKLVGPDTRVALRNTGATDVTVDVVGMTASNERMVATATIRASDFGEVTFKSAKPIVSVEIDADKLYPQTDYSDDIAPKASSESDPLLAAKRAFDKQDLIGAERTAKTLLAGLPRFDDLRVLLGRSLLAEGRPADAEREFKAVIDEKLPTARSLAWAYVGLAEIAAKAGQTAQARTFADTAVMIDADYGASFAARAVRSAVGGPTPDPAAKAFFAEFDKAVAAKRKADVDSMTLPGEIVKFASGIAGSAETWQTKVLYTDSLDANTMLVETNMNIRLLNKNDETGTAVYRLVRVGNTWKLAAVDVFEVR